MQRRASPEHRPEGPGTQKDMGGRGGGGGEQSRCREQPCTGLRHTVQEAVGGRQGGWNEWGAWE